MNHLRGANCGRRNHASPMETWKLKVKKLNAIVEGLARDEVKLVCCGCECRERVVRARTVQSKD